MRALKVLHVVEPAAGVEGVIACREALGIRGVEHQVLLIGSEEDARTAARAGLGVRDRIAAPLGNARLAARRYAAVFEGRYWRKGAEEEAPRVQMCYSVGALAVTRAALGRSGPQRVGLLPRPAQSHPSSAGEYRMEKYALTLATLACFDRATRASYAWQASAIRGGTYLEQNIRLFDPPVPGAGASRTSPEERADLKAELGIAPDHAVLALLADPPLMGDAFRFAFLLGLCFAARIRVTGIVPRGVGQAPRAARFVRDHDRRWGLTVSPWGTERTLRAADAAIVLTPEPGVRSQDVSCGAISMCAALAQGVPVFAAGQEPARALLGPALAEYCVGERRMHNQVGSLVIRALSERGAMEGLRGLSLERGEEIRGGGGPFGSRFRDDLLALWKEVTGMPIEREGLPVPPMLLNPRAEPVMVD